MEDYKDKTTYGRPWPTWEDNIKYRRELIYEIYKVNNLLIFAVQHNTLIFSY